MTSSEQTLVDLFKKKEEHKAAIAEINKQIDAEFALGGHKYNEMFQDEEGTVYKFVRPDGTFIKFTDLDYVRTRRNGETKGSLSMKEAEAAGFHVPKGE